jgi:hypothetical protein
MVGKRTWKPATAWEDPIGRQARPKDFPKNKRTVLGDLTMVTILNRKTGTKIRLTGLGVLPVQTRASVREKTGRHAAVNRVFCLRAVSPGCSPPGAR